MPAARPLWVLRATAILVTVAFCSLNPLPADAQVSCADWNTANFFVEAGAHDVTRCVAAGSDPNARGKAGYSPLHSAAANSTDPAVLATLLDAGADLESKGETGLTPLHVAAGGSSEPAVLMVLLNAGADPVARTDAGFTPLHVAAGGSSKPAVVTALVNAGADPDARTDAGFTPLHVAARGSSEPAVVTALVNAGADPDARDNAGYTPLHVAAAGSAVPEIVTALANAGADLEARAESGLTPLHVAARSSSVPGVVTALVDAGADLQARTESETGFTALHAAAGMTGTPAIVTALVDAGADLEAKTGSGLTPLHVAAAVGKLPAVVTALVNAGADPDARDDIDRTAGDYVQFNDVLKDTEAYDQLKGAITIMGPDMVETWMQLGAMIVWGVAVLAGLVLWGLFSSRLGRRVRHVGSAATIGLTGFLSLLAPGWAVALYGHEPVGASLAELMVASIETGIMATWTTIFVIVLVYSLVFRKHLHRRIRIAGGIAMSLVAVVVSYHASDWFFWFG